MVGGGGDGAPDKPGLAADAEGVEDEEGVVAQPVQGRGNTPDSVSAKYEYRITSVVLQATSMAAYAGTELPSSPRATSGNGPVTPHTIAYRLNTCISVVMKGARTTPACFGEPELVSFLQ